MSRDINSLPDTAPIFAASMREEIAPILDEFCRQHLAAVGSDLCSGLKNRNTIEVFKAFTPAEKILVFKCAIATLMAECEARKGTTTL